MFPVISRNCIYPGSCVTVKSDVGMDEPKVTCHQIWAGLSKMGSTHPRLHLPFPVFFVSFLPMNIAFLDLGSQRPSRLLFPSVL